MHDNAQQPQKLTWKVVMTGSLSLHSSFLSVMLTRFLAASTSSIRPVTSCPTLYLLLLRLPTVFAVCRVGTIALMHNTHTFQMTGLLDLITSALVDHCSGLQAGSCFAQSLQKSNLPVIKHAALMR